MLPRGEEDEARTEDRATVLTYQSSSLDRNRMIAAIRSVGKRELPAASGERRPPSRSMAVCVSAREAAVRIFDAVPGFMWR
jgi:hypothetical protein